jgi:hypothetical protein
LIIALKKAEDIFRIKVGHRKAARADPMLSVIRHGPLPVIAPENNLTRHARIAAEKWLLEPDSRIAPE